MWHSVPVERLGIPVLKVTDGPNGARGAEGTSGPASACFPADIALAATWNLALAEHVGQALDEETRAKGAHILLGPTVNIHRSPLSGRNFEFFLEDPYLSGRMATAYITGLQNQGIGACIKQWATVQDKILVTLEGRFRLISLGHRCRRPGCPSAHVTLISAEPARLSGRSSTRR
jgi:beta-glucosidase